MLAFSYVNPQLAKMVCFIFMIFFKSVKKKHDFIVWHSTQGVKVRFFLLQIVKKAKK